MITGFYVTLFMRPLMILLHKEGEFIGGVCVIPVQFFLKSFGVVPQSLMSVDFIIILISMLRLYPVSSNVFKRDLSSFHCVENLMLSTPWSIAQGKIFPSVAVVLCFVCLFCCCCCFLFLEENFDFSGFFSFSTTLLIRTKCVAIYLCVQ